MNNQSDYLNSRLCLVIKHCIVKYELVRVIGMYENSEDIDGSTVKFARTERVVRQYLY